MKDFLDDKTLVIMVMGLLGLTAMFVTLSPESAEIVKLAFASIGGMAVGKALK